jgi:hypothetical protein
MKNDLLIQLQSDANWHIIQNMSESELSAYLQEYGYSPERLHSNCSKLQSKLLLAHKRCERLTTVSPQLKDYSGYSMAELIEMFIKKFGSIEQIPIAARSFKELNLKDVQELAKELLG